MDHGRLPAPEDENSFQRSAISSQADWLAAES